GYTAVFGAQSEQSQMRSDGSPSHAQARQNSAYLQLQGEVTRGLTLTAGGRYDDHDTFGSHGTGQAAIAWELPSSTVLRASWGQGFKAPSLYQLFSEYANPALQPETSNGWDAGIEQHLLEGRAMVSVTGFARTSRSLISYVGCGFPADPNSLCAEPGHSTFGYYDNITRTDARGVELQAAWQLTDTFDLTANYTYTHAEDRSPESTDFGLPLLRRPRGMANATATWRAPFGLTSSLALRYVSASDDMDFDQFPAARVHLAAYTLVDLRLAWSVTDAVKLAARIENLFDENYQTVLNYGATGRAGYVSVRYDF
ncbi:MAG: TonB-dependent receptor, partial [Nevskiaceae bacterium]|nr:TonB-dependent receptor [Nevskiaceae bacterium]